MITHKQMAAAAVYDTGFPQDKPTMTIDDELARLRAERDQTVALLRQDDAKIAGLRRERDALAGALRDCVESLKRMPEIDGAFKTTCLQQARAALESVKSP